VRFIHTADLQLMLPKGDVSGERSTLQEARFHTLERIVTLASDEHVDFIAICGDVFEDTLVSDETIYRALRILGQAAPIPVFILPGNHDPLTAQSVYKRPAFETATENVWVLTTSDPVLLDENCTIYPCPVTAKKSINDPTAVIPVRENDDDIRIGLAHGSLMIESMHQPDDHPIALEAAQTKGLDYLALGHWHSTLLMESNRIAYSGTHEQTAFDESSSGNVLLVTIDAPRAVPKLETKRVGELTWLQWERPIAEPIAEAMQRLRAEIDGLESKGKTLLRLVLTGAVSADSLLQLEQFGAWLREAGLLRAELISRVECVDELAGALKALAESDEVIAGTVADLQRLVHIDAPASDEGAEVLARSTQELMDLWQEARLKDSDDMLQELSSDLKVADAANNALLILARTAQGVRQ